MGDCGTRGVGGGYDKRPAAELHGHDPPTLLRAWGRAALTGVAASLPPLTYIPTGMYVAGPMNATPAPATHRDPVATRQALLGAAFEEIQAVGFRAASLDNILARVGVTKGALYHHFPNKNALGLAVIDELIWPQSRRHFEVLADPTLHPVDALISILKDEITTMGGHEHIHGCPVCNLVQDMAGVDEAFRLRLLRIHEAWQEAITQALKRGQQAGQIRRDADAAHMAALMVAAYEGANVMAKAAADDGVFHSAMQGLIALGESLRVR